MGGQRRVHFSIASDFTFAEAAFSWTALVPPAL
jgi:hypothetical protein